jgi:hypothetical protein
MSSTSRNHRNNPYVLDGLAVAFHRSAAGIAWRWRTELAILTLVTAAVWWLTYLIATQWHLTRLTGLAWAGVIVALALVGIGMLPWTRRRFWCLLARHRIQRLCYEARLHTRSGRLPLVLWVRPTKVGERLYILCRAGICAEDFQAHLGELRAACYAREARVTRNPRWSHLVTIDIIRRDTLAASNTVPSPLPGKVIPLPLRPYDGAA